MHPMINQRKIGFTSDSDIPKLAFKVGMRKTWSRIFIRCSLLTSFQAIWRLLTRQQSSFTRRVILLEVRCLSSRCSFCCWRIECFSWRCGFRNLPGGSTFSKIRQETLLISSFIGSHPYKLKRCQSSRRRNKHPPSHLDTAVAPSWMTFCLSRYSSWVGNGG